MRGAHVHAGHISNISPITSQLALRLDCIADPTSQQAQLKETIEKYGPVRQPVRETTLKILRYELLFVWVFASLCFFTLNNFIDALFDTTRCVCSSEYSECFRNLRTVADQLTSMMKQNGQVCEFAKASEHA